MLEITFSWLDKAIEEVALNEPHDRPYDKRHTPGQPLAVGNPRERLVVNSMPEKDGHCYRPQQRAKQHLREREATQKLNTQFHPGQHDARNDQVEHRRWVCRSSRGGWCHPFDVVPLQHEDDVVHSTYDCPRRPVVLVRLFRVC